MESTSEQDVKADGTNGKRTRIRRERGEPRRLLISSARKLFARSGYSGVSSREVAQNAGLNEAIVYRYFKSKADLFDYSVSEPVRNFVSDYVERMRTRSPASLSPVDEPTREFLGGFYDELMENRRLVMAWLSAHAFEDDVIELSQGRDSPFSQVVDQLREFVGIAAELNHLPEHDYDLLTRWVILFTMGTMLEEWILPPMREPRSRDQIVDEMTRLWVHGLSHSANSQPGTSQ